MLQALLSYHDIYCGLPPNREQTFKLLEERGVEVDELRRWIKFEVLLSDSESLHRVKTSIEQLIEHPSTEFCERMTDRVNSMVKQFEATLDVTRQFMPTRRYSWLKCFRVTAHTTLLRLCCGRASMERIRRIQCEDIVLSRLKRFVRNCDSALDFIKLETSAIISGSRKQELTEWWLTLIAERVDARLYFL